MLSLEFARPLATHAWFRQNLKVSTFSRGIARIARGPIVQAEFLALCFASDYVHSYWALAEQGSTFREVSIASVKELPLAVPPLSEQTRLLNNTRPRLGQVAVAQALTNKLIEHLQHFRTALISAAVTGQIDVREKAA
jgi:type I restriction enzyme S subunit